MPNLAEFENYPSLADLLPSTPKGVPGVRYKIVLAHNSAEAQKEGWEMTLAQMSGGPGGRAFYVGPGQACFLMCQGIPVASLGSGTVKCTLEIDVDLAKVMGDYTDVPVDLPDSTPSDEPEPAQPATLGGGGRTLGG